MLTEAVQGNLFDQKVDVIVNPWNQNIIPWWLLNPHGVSGAIKKHGGFNIFRELGKQGVIPLGKAVHTSAGYLPFIAIIHVACISPLGHTTKKIIEASTRNAVILAEEIGVHSIAFPVIGSGSGRFDKQVAEGILITTLKSIDSPLSSIVVRYKSD